MRSLMHAVLVAAALGIAGSAAAHCQIPCGIYDDELRVRLIEEHITTIEKSMNQVVALGKETPVNSNQLVRWVMNKEDHAQQLQDIVTAYFMAQRVKPTDASDAPAYAKYIQQLTLLHRMQVLAMKAKQTTDLAQVEALRALIKEFRTAYFGPEAGHSH